MALLAKALRVKPGELVPGELPAWRKDLRPPTAGAGFAILVLSRFLPTFWSGLFTAAAMLLSQLATLTMLPGLFLLTGYPKRPAAVQPDSP